jgi:hypothetical protein
MCSMLRRTSSLNGLPSRTPLPNSSSILAFVAFDGGTLFTVEPSILELIWPKPTGSGRAQPLPLLQQL